MNGGNTLVTVPAARPAAGGAPGLERDHAPAQDVETTLPASGQFTYLLSALKTTRLDKALKKKNKKTKKADPFTIFAPTDTAFAKLPPEELQALFADKARLKALLSYHIAPAAVTSAEIRTAGGQATAAGPAVAFEANAEAHGRRPGHRAAGRPGRARRLDRGHRQGADPAEPAAADRLGGLMREGPGPMVRAPWPSPANPPPKTPNCPPKSPCRFRT